MKQVYSIGIADEQDLGAYLHNELNLELVPKRKDFSGMHYDFSLRSNDSSLSLFEKIRKKLDAFYSEHGFNFNSEASNSLPKRRFASLYYEHVSGSKGNVMYVHAKRSIDFFVTLEENQKQRKIREHTI